ncbi:MAG TPA: large conductance mechanosensitive channel protein MscL [Acidimicrobiales bacterium]|nr:large conductance mechanosensitive channel protein MscL [Acidimicrobiales bacterium]
MLDGFKKFIIQGNAIDLAVGLILGLAFKEVVNALVDGIIMPIIAAVIGQPNFNDLGIDIGDSVIRYGVLITAVVNLVLVGAALYFFLVLPMNTLKERRARGEEPADPTNEEKMVALLEQIAAK